MKAAGIFKVGNHLLIPRYTLIWPRRMAVKDTGSPRSGWPSVLKIHSTTIGVTQCPFDKVMTIHNALVLNLERGQHPYLHSQSHWQNSITAISVLFTCFGLFAYFSCVSLICWSISFVFTGLAYSNVIWTVVYVMELIIPVSKEVMFACLECIFRSDVLLRSSCHIHLAYFSGEDTERFFFHWADVLYVCEVERGGVAELLNYMEFTTASYAIRYHLVELKGIHFGWFAEISACKTILQNMHVYLCAHRFVRSVSAHLGIHSQKHQFSFLLWVFGPMATGCGLGCDVCFHLVYTYKSAVVIRSVFSNFNTVDDRFPRCSKYLASDIFHLPAFYKVCFKIYNLRSWIWLFSIFWNSVF